MVGTCQGVVSLGVLGQLFGNVEAGVVATKEGKKVSVVAHQLKRNTLRTDQGGIRVIPIKFAHILSLPVLCNSGAIATPTRDCVLANEFVSSIEFIMALHYNNIHAL